MPQRIVRFLYRWTQTGSWIEWALCLILIRISWIRITQNSFKTFWLDETLTVFIAGHAPWSASFYAALKSHVAGLPLAFIEYGIYLKLLKLLSFSFLMQHIEFFLRLPLVVYSLVTVCAVFFMIRHLSRSSVVAGLLTWSLFIINFLSAHLASELRFHSSAMAHMAVSWCFLAYALTPTEDKEAGRHRYMWLWLISAGLAGWVHLYAIYSVSVQIFVFLLVFLKWLPHVSFPQSFSRNALIRFFFLAILLWLGPILYYAFIATHPYSRQGSDVIPDFLTVMKELSRFIFWPSMWVWLLIFVGIFIGAIRRCSKRLQRLKIGVLGALVLSQIILMGLLMFMFLKLSWGGTSWSARYTMAGLVPLIFFFALLSRNVVTPKQDARLALWVGLMMLGVSLIIPAKNYTYWNYLSQRGDHPRWKALPALLREHQVKSVSAVIGLKSVAKVFDQTDIHGDGVDITWQLYTHGPFVFEDQIIEGRLGSIHLFSCKAREYFPLSSPGVISKFGYALDYCEKEKVYLRNIKK